MSKTEEPKIEEVTTEGAAKDDEDDMPALEGQDGGAKLNRGEKKCRKALQKLGMKQVEGFTRISLRKRDGIIFVMEQPEVFKSSESSFCCFGELKIDDPNQRMQQMEAQKFKDSQAAMAEAQAAMASAGGAGAKEEVKASAGGDEAPEIEEGLTASHIDMVMNHASCTRNEAIRALRAADDDMIAAVMKLTQ